MNSTALAIIPITVALPFMGLGSVITEPVFAYYGGYHGFAYHGAGYHRGFEYHGFGYHRGFEYHGFGYQRGFEYHGFGYHRGFGFHEIHIINQVNNCDRCLNNIE